MRTRTQNIYTFRELSESAKERARQWFRELESSEFGADPLLYEPTETAAKILGIEFAKQDVKLMGGATRQASKIWWRGFSSQGDGASFEGYYSYAKNSRKRIREEFSADEKLWTIADRLAELQRKHSYKIRATITQSGRYVHKYTMSADVYIGENDSDASTSEAILQSMRDFAEWIYQGLRNEYDYRMSDEAVDEAIMANGYEFLDDGEFVRD